MKAIILNGAGTEDDGICEILLSRLKSAGWEVSNLTVRWGRVSYSFRNSAGYTSLCRPSLFGLSRQEPGPYFFV